jgi:glycosyltransferase involved in cell wall biosynthesis
MRIVHISTLFFPLIGGLEIAAQRVAEEQAKLGHEVYVVTSSAYVEGRLRREKGAVSVIRVKSWKNPYPYLIVPREIPRDILREADVVFGWGHSYYFVYEMVKRAKVEFKKPIIQYFIGVDYLKYHYNPLIKILGYLYQKLLTKGFVRIVDLALVTNEHERRLLKEGYGLDAIVVPHGIDEVYLKLPSMAEDFRRKYNVKGKIVAFIGRIHPTKGLDLLIKAFAEVAMKVPGAVLIIAGSGDERYLGECLKLARILGVEEKVKYIGYISEEDKIALIDASDAVVLPTKHAGESYPLLINEVLARGKKLIITRGNIASRWIEESGIAKVVNPDPQELARAITDELASKNSIKVNNKKTVKIHTWRDVAYRFLELSQQILEGEGLIRS